MSHPTANQPLSNIPMFFIIGRPRSGTTMLRMLFEAHPNVLVPPESPFILNLYKKYGKVTHWDKEIIKAYHDDVFKQRYFDKWLIGKDELLNHLMEAEGELSFQTMVKKTCLAYHSVYEKEEIRLIGDKNPGYSLYINRIHKLFPEAKIIHLTRDYRDNYLSLINVNFEVPIVPLVVYRWKFALRLARNLKNKHPELIYSLKYEDLAANPEKHSREVCNFLNIEFDTSVFSFHEKKNEFEKAYSGSKEINVIHKSLLNPISTSRMELWKTQMAIKDIQLADLVAGKTAEEAGYKRQFTSFGILKYIKVFPVIIYGSIMYRLMLLGDHLPHRMRIWLNQVLGIFLKVYWKLNRRKVNPLK